MIKRIADKLFFWFCNPSYYPDIQGDLEELYNDHLEQNRRFAQLRYFVDVMLLFRLSLLKPITQIFFIKDTGMLKNYFKISARSLARHKLFTTINTVGLAIGLASFLLMYEYIKFEKSYDTFHKDANDLYRISYVRVLNGADADTDAMAAYPVGKTLKDEMPEIQDYTISKKFDALLVRNENVFYKELSVISADPSFLKLFNYPVLEGDIETMLTEPRSIVLTQERAKAYFGDRDPMGQTLEIVSPYKATFKITGIIADVPDNTHYKFNMLISDKTLADGQDYNKWNWNNYYIYFKVANANVESLERKANEVLDKYINDKDDNEHFETYGTRVDVHPIVDIHLKSNFNFEPQVHGSEKAVTFLIIISISILIIAWVNYINLSTARSLERAKEVGMRKVIGAFRGQLVIQFLCEAFLVNLAGAIIALMIAQVATPFFNILVGKQIIQSVWSHPPFFFALLIFTLIGTLASGFYPAIVLSDFQPITVLKGKFQNSKKGVALRKILVIVQFSSSLVLIASTMIIYSQVRYMQGKDMGISVDQVVNVTIPESDADTEEAYKSRVADIKMFKKELENHSGVLAVGATSNLPGGSVADINSTTTPLKVVGKTELVEGTTYVQYNDEGFLNAVDMVLLAGRNFDDQLKSDSSAVMVNESFLRKMNISDYDSILGQKIQFGRKTTNSKYNVIGVVKDFNRTSLKLQIEPSLYFPWPGADDLVIKLNGGDYQSGLDHVRNTWEKFYRDSPYELTFLDKRFKALYDQDQKFGDTFMVFAILAVFIGILGLFGLSSFLSLQRSKEVGVRKVLGASQKQIIYIFFKDFLILIGLSACIGIPLVYYLMNGWLDNYAYRIDFPWVLTGLSAVVIFVFAFITVSYQTLKVASLNPAVTLKDE